MAFVRTVKITSETEKHYEYSIVESYWEKGKRKQRVIANLGNCAVLREASYASTSEPAYTQRRMLNTLKIPLPPWIIMNTK